MDNRIFDYEYTRPIRPEIREILATKRVLIPSSSDGKSTTVSTTRTLINNNCTFNYKLTANGLISVVSTSAEDLYPTGTGVNMIQLTGLDNNYAIVTEIILMNGTTPVVSTNQFHRVNNTLVFFTGTTQNAVGLITGTSVSNTGNQHFKINALDTNSSLGHFTIPAGYTGIVSSSQFSCGNGDEIIIDLLVSNPSLPPQVVDSFILYQTVLSASSNVFSTIPEKFDFYHSATSFSGANRKASVSVSYYLIKNTDLARYNTSSAINVGL